MKIDRNNISEEDAMLSLQSLYRRYGYSRYKMGKFEEYELYLRNKDFVPSGSIIAFSDGTGRMMALKPDLTLSIVKNYRYKANYAEKIFYNENIYRTVKPSGAQKEMAQTGLECLGDIDIYQVAEVTKLAAQSLEMLGRDYVLEISHMAMILDILKDVEDDAKESIISLIGQKNMDGVRKVCDVNSIPEETEKNIEKLIGTYGEPDKVLESLEDIEFGKEGKAALKELETVIGILDEDPKGYPVKIDFSIVNDMNYYSGILFKGFVEGVPKSMLSGGRYDKLMKRMDKKGGAIGFALYLDNLEYIKSDDQGYDVENVLLYGDEDNPDDVTKAAAELSNDSVVLVERSVPEKLRYRSLYKMKDGEAKKIG